LQFVDPKQVKWRSAHKDSVKFDPKSHKGRLVIKLQSAENIVPHGEKAGKGIAVSVSFEILSGRDKIAVGKTGKSEKSTQPDFGEIFQVPLAMPDSDMLEMTVFWAGVMSDSKLHMHRWAVGEILDRMASKGVLAYLFNDKGNTGKLFISFEWLEGTATVAVPTKAASSSASSFKKPKHQEIVFSKPSNFRHTAHMGWDASGGFDVSRLPEEWKELFKKAGIRPRDLRDPDTAKEIIAVIAENMPADAQPVATNVPQSSVGDGLPPAIPPRSTTGLPPALPPKQPTGPPSLPPKPQDTATTSPVDDQYGMTYENPDQSQHYQEEYHQQQQYQEEYAAQEEYAQEEYQQQYQEEYQSQQYQEEYQQHAYDAGSQAQEEYTATADETQHDTSQYEQYSHANQQSTSSAPEIAQPTQEVVPVEDHPVAPIGGAPLPPPLPPPISTGGGPPPAPKRPPPAPMAKTGGDARSGLLSDIQGGAHLRSVSERQLAPAPEDDRGSLLASIRAGRALKKVDPNQVAAELPALKEQDKNNLVGLLSAAMSSRRADMAGDTTIENEDDDDWE
jgi:Wiskott-Aldrich syndrome protein